MSAQTKIFPNGIPEFLDKYEVKTYPRGLAVFGYIPLDHMKDLVKLWEKQGYTMMHFPLAEALKATMVLVKDEATAEEWKKELDIRFDNPDWLKSGDTGLSSKTIYAIMEGKWGCLSRGSDDFTTPYDADDFGRCYRLVKRYPLYADRLQEIVPHCAAWKPIADNWTSLCSLFEEEGKLDEKGFPTVKKMPQFNKSMEALRKEFEMIQAKDKFVFFWGGFMSNWFPSEFTVDGVKYNCGEQWMMAEKARVFKDEEALKKIMAEENPRIQKAHGRKIVGYSDDIWRPVARERVYIGLVEKFKQNPELKKNLLETGDKIIVEASPEDKLWGIGMAADHPDIYDPEKWQGQNWLGETLMRVRDFFLPNVKLLDKEE